MPAPNNKRDISPPRESEKPRSGSHIYQRYASDYRSVSPVQDPKKDKKEKKPEMVARVDGPGWWDCAPAKM